MTQSDEHLRDVSMCNAKHKIGYVGNDLQSFQERWVKNSRNSKDHIVE